MRRERGSLQVRQHAPDRVAPACVDGVLQCSLRADQDRAGDEQLGDVDVQRRLRRTQSRRREVDEHRPLVDDQDVAGVQPSMRDACRLEMRHLPPELLERLVSTWSACERLEGGDVGLPSDDERVSARAERGRDHLGGPDSRLGSQQRGERLVLDLFEAPDARHFSADRGRRALAIDGRGAGCPVRRDRAPERAAVARGCRCPTYSAEPIRCVSDGFRSATGTPSAASALLISAVGGTPAAVPNAIRVSEPAPRPRDNAARAADGIAAPKTTAPSAASGTSQNARSRNGRISSGPTTTRAAVAPASLSSGYPQRDRRCGSSGSQSEPTRPPRMIPAPRSSTAATSRSRTRSQRRRHSTSTMTTRGSASAKTKTVRQKPPAHPSTVVSACATAASCLGADDAIAADRPTTTAAPAKRTESIVLRLRRPRSVFVSSPTVHGRSAGSPCSSRLTLVAVTSTPLRPDSPSIRDRALGDTMWPRADTVHRVDPNALATLADAAFTTTPPEAKAASSVVLQPEGRAHGLNRPQHHALDAARSTRRTRRERRLQRLRVMPHACRSRLFRRGDIARRLGSRGRPACTDASVTSCSPRRRRNDSAELFAGSPQRPARTCAS